MLTTLEFALAMTSIAMGETHLADNEANENASLLIKSFP
jgi:hypothetical protein